MIRSISDAVVLKDENLFLVMRRDGCVPSKATDAYGLYYNDTRFLNAYELSFDGVTPIPLAVVSDGGFYSSVQLTNPDLNLEDGGKITKQKIHVRWNRLLTGREVSLYDTFEIEYFGRTEVRLPLHFTFRAQFEDVYEVRGMRRDNHGERHDPSWSNDGLTFLYDGVDGVRRSVLIRFSPRPDETNEAGAKFRFRLSPGERIGLQVSVSLAQSTARPCPVEDGGRSEAELKKIKRSREKDCDDWLRAHTEIHSDNIPLNRTIKRSLLDLRILRSSLQHEEYFAAGLPWFGTLFGRDSLIAAIQMLAFHPDMAAQTLRLMARYQGTHVDEWRAEAPGRILHELRVGELTNSGEIPRSPYYGTVDAPLLFLILVGLHAEWTGKTDLFRELRINIDRILDWIAKYADISEQGYVQYENKSDSGLENQGWKDSGNAIVDTNGDLAKPPIALVEVQAYLYMARTKIAHLFERVGEQQRSQELTAAAETLRDRFNIDYWNEDECIYAMALQQGGDRLRVVSSNAGQALWAGIATEERAAMTCRRLMTDDMFSGWGVRTLSQQEKAYNPIGYHVGTVWPHDNSIIAAGCKRYGHAREALRIANGFLEAAAYFEHYRLPEAFCGFGKDGYRVPVHYPVACRPQAWASGALPFMMQTVLGLVPDGFNQRLKVSQPSLPDNVEQLEVRRLRVGEGSIDLRFTRHGKRVDVEPTRVDGNLNLEVEDG